MKTSVKDLGQITTEIVRSWTEKYEKKGDFYYCKECGSRIKQTTCYVSIHAKEFEPSHAGPGRVVHIFCPYCPKFDGKIDYAQACYHIEAFKRESILLDIITLPITPGETVPEGSMAKNTLIVNIPEDLYQKFIATVTAEGGLWRKAESPASAIESAVFAALMLFLQGLGLSGDLPEFRDYAAEKYPSLDEDLVTMIEDLIKQESERLTKKG